MLDELWLRNLAQGSFKAGNLQPQDPAATAAYNQQQIDETIPQLRERLSRACQAFNRYAPAERQMNLLSLAAESTEKYPSLLLLLGRCHLKLQHGGDRLLISVYQVQGYEKTLAKQVLLHAMPSSLGGLLWQVDGGPLLTQELIIKFLFEELILVWSLCQDSHQA